jgi:hypothetical protein
MAVAQATMQKPGIFQNLIEGVARRIDDVSGNRLGNWLRDSTGLTPLPDFLSRQNFGVVKALQSTRKPPSLSDMLLETMNHAIEEARDRLSSLVNGSFIPSGVQELFAYLREHSFDLETRFNKITGEITNLLVDRTSKQAVPAAQVDPSLSYRNVLQLELKTRLREQIGGETPARAYGSWGGMAWMRETTSSKFGYTVDKGQGYFGRVVGIVSEDQAENDRLFAVLKERGIDTIVPKSTDGTGNPVIGMPILARNKSLKAEEVDRNLSHDILTQKFGTGLIDYYQDLAKKATSPTVIAAIAPKVSREEFAKMFLRVEKDIDPNPQFGFDNERETADIVLKTDKHGTVRPWDRENGKPVFTSIPCLKSGEYERYDANNKLTGYTMVGDNGKVTNYDTLYKEIKPLQTVKPTPRQENSQNVSYGFA